eukprot:Filipodium_phascolosomae@DN706_c0_g1_i1.p1
MFGLIYGFWKAFWARPSYRVVILGLDNAGKTTLLNQIKDQFSDAVNSSDKGRLARTVPTIGLNIGSVSLPQFNCEIVFWDLGGQQAFRQVWHRYYSDASAVFFVVDMLDQSRLKEAAAVLNEIVNSTHIKNATTMPLAIFANKMDSIHTNISTGHSSDTGDASDHTMSDSNITVLSVEDIMNLLCLGNIVRNDQNSRDGVLRNTNCISWLGSRSVSTLGGSGGSVGVGNPPVAVFRGSALEGTGIQEAVLWLASVLK